LNKPEFVSARRTFVTPDGPTIVADAWGDDRRPAVILAHGGGQTRHAWGGTARTLAAHGWYALSIDLRGHGESDWAADGDYDLTSFGRDFVAIARQFAPAPVLVGASLSGLAALLAQGEAEATVFSALVLVDVTPRLDPKGADEIVSFMRANMEEGFATLEEAADTIAAYVPHRRRPKDLSGLEKNLRRGADGRYRWHWDPKFVAGKSRPSTTHDPSRLLAAASRLRIPALLVRGRMSNLVTPEAAREFLDLVPHARYVDISDAGHMVAGDRNDLFTGAVAEFLDSLPNGA
jgi:pimeloyl-ACP methyl ester carboxylesterase